MPRRNGNAKHDQQAKRRRRGAYRPDAAQALDRIERKRKRLGVTLAELAARIGCAESTIRRMRHAGAAFPRRLKALTFALRAIERERASQAGDIAGDGP